MGPRHDRPDAGDRPAPPPLPVDPDLAPDDPGEPSATHRVAPTERGPAERRRAAPTVLAAVALGGALGAVARALVAERVGGGAGGFPWATFATNVAGSLALGVVLVLVLRAAAPHPLLRPFLATGLLGALTTFSTFVVEADRLVADGRPGLAGGYVVGSVALGLAAAAAGMAVGRRVPRRAGGR
ncbi:MAG: CrcB family protein [Acidimicrobiales bacterium]|nr:CrcB family protein [Acidimicrobiales bacterium]